MRTYKTVALALMLALGTSELAAQSSLLTSRGQISGTTIRWTELFGTPNYILTGGQTAQIGGLTVSVNPALPGEVLKQGWGSWPGNFSPGDDVLYSKVGPIELLFSEDIFAFGSNIQSSNMSAFTGTIAAFDEFGNDVGLFNRDGVSNWANDGSAIFMGIGSSVGIRRILMYTDGSGVAINQAVFGVEVDESSLLTPTIEAGELPIITNPEPTTVVMFGAGMLLVGAAYRRRKA